VARKGKRRDVYRVLAEKKTVRKRPPKDLGVDRRLTLYWILKKCDAGVWTG